eukprot:928781_1
MTESGRPNITILGTGWATMSLVKELTSSSCGSRFDITVVSPHAHFTYTPHLPGVLTGMFQREEAVVHVEDVWARSRYQNVEFVHAECVRIDHKNKTLECIPDNSEPEGKNSNNFQLNFTFLVIAVGSGPNMARTPGVLENAFCLRDIRDTDLILERIEENISEVAKEGQNEDAIQRLLTCIVAGAGPVGVECAAGLRALMCARVAKISAELLKFIRVIILESSDDILRLLGPSLQDFAREHIERHCIQLEHDVRVMRADESHVHVRAKDNTERAFEYGLFVWAAGNSPRPLISDFIAELGEEHQPDPRGLTVGPCLAVAGTEGVWALGDCVSINGVPATGAAATRQAAYLAGIFKGNRRHLMETGSMAKNTTPYNYEFPGVFVYIGNKTVAGMIPLLFNRKLCLSGYRWYLVWFLFHKMVFSSLS